MTLTTQFEDFQGLTALEVFYASFFGCLKAVDTELLPLQLEFTPLHHHQLQPKSVLIIRP
jgi:hypothetical protein